MNQTLKREDSKKSVLRWGGLAGLLAGVMIILSLSIQIAFAPPLFVPAGPDCGPICYVDASLAIFPNAKVAMTVHNIFYFLAVMMIAILVVTLYRALSTEGSSLAPALSGVSVGFLGLAMLAAGSIVSVSFAHLSNVYHAAGTQDQATLVLVSHAVQAIYNETDAVGGLMLGTGFVLFGLAMVRNPSFGKRLGTVNIMLGLIAIVGIGIASIALDNPNDPFFVILVLVLPLILGSKLYKLSGPIKQGI